MVVKKIDVKDELLTLSEKTKQLREKFEKSYVRGNETIEFQEEFQQKQDQVEKLFTSAENEQDVKSVAKLIVDIGKELRTLEKLFSVSSMFILPQVHGICDDLIWSFEDRLAVLKKCHLLNKRIVKEVEKPAVVKPVNNTNISGNSNNNNNNNNSNNNNINNTIPTNSNNIVNNPVPVRSQTVTKLIRNTTEFTQYKTMTGHDKVYTLENLSGVALTLTQRVINSNRVLLTGLTSCCVKINFPLESLRILFCKYCQIFVGQVATSLIKNTYNSLISINGDKVRIEYCESTLFKIPTKSNAVVNECYHLEFANYENECDKKPDEEPVVVVRDTELEDKNEEQSPIINDDKGDKENIVGLCSSNMEEVVFSNSTI